MLSVAAAAGGIRALETLNDIADASALRSSHWGTSDPKVTTAARNRGSTTGPQFKLTLFEKAEQTNVCKVAMTDVPDDPLLGKNGYVAGQDEHEMPPSAG